MLSSPSLTFRSRPSFPQAYCICFSRCPPISCLTFFSFPWILNLQTHFSLLSQHSRLPSGAWPLIQHSVLKHTLSYNLCVTLMQPDVPQLAVMSSCVYANSYSPCKHYTLGMPSVVPTVWTWCSFLWLMVYYAHSSFHWSTEVNVSLSASYIGFPYAPGQFYSPLCLQCLVNQCL